MLKIEVWKCRPTWLALSSEERDTFFDRFSVVIRRNLGPEARADGGPYLIYPTSGCLLLWTWEPQPEGEVVRARQELDTYFELLVDVGVSATLTAKSLASKLKA